MNNNTCEKCKFFTACGDAERVVPCSGYEKITRADIIGKIHDKQEAIVLLEKIKKEYADEWSALFEEYKKAARENGPEAARIGKKLDELRNGKKDTGAAITDKKTEITILKHNYRIALFDECMPIVLEILKKYNGKKYGEKTRAKIRDEIKARAGVNFYINRRTWCDEIIISDDFLCYSGQLEINTRADENGTRAAIITDDNKINAPDIDNLFMHYNTFVDNIPERVQALKTAHNDARQLQEQLKTACNKYNDLTVNGMKTICYTDHIY